jgi:hypothetical protein
MNNINGPFYDRKYFIYKNISFLVSPLLYTGYTCNVCDERKYSSKEKGFTIVPFRDIVSLGFRNGTFCSSCVDAFMDNPDKFVFEHSLGLLTKN